MRVEESKVVSGILEDLAENTRINYKTTLKQFLKFVNSKEGLNKEISIDGGKIWSVQNAGMNSKLVMKFTIGAISLLMNIFVGSVGMKGTFNAATA